MRPFSLLLCLCLPIMGCGNKQPWEVRLRNPKLDAKQFTRLVAEEIRKRNPEAKVTVEETLSISVKADDGEYSCYLDNAWRECRDTPLLRENIVNRQLETLRNTTEIDTEAPIEIEKVVPVIKDKLWIDETIKRGLQVHHVAVVGDVFTVFAEDHPTQLRYLSEEDIQSLAMSSEQLQAHAINNLRKLLPKVERHGEGPTYMLTAGGTFEASLLLVPEIWESQEPSVSGRVVIGIPARDLILFTGENETSAIVQMREKVKEIHQSGNYLISKTLLMLNDDGKWIPLVEQ